MKQLIFIITLVLLGMQLKAQLITDKWGNIISYSPTEGYKESDLLPVKQHFIIPRMDNDSLCKIYNNGKSIEELGNRYVSGFDLRCEPISLKENGLCIKLKHGKLWRYAIEGASAKRIGVDLGYPKLPKGSYIEIFPTDTTINLDQQREMFNSESLSERQKKSGLKTLGYGKSLMIEYYEPDTLKEKEDIVIKKIIYGFVGFEGPSGSSYNNTQLKSGHYGSSKYPQCQKDVICSDIGNYQNQAKSVVLIRLFYDIDTNKDGYNEFYDDNGTGFFLNKVGGYADSDSPILVTAGHGYYLNLYGSVVDLDSHIWKIEARTNYQNAVCGTDDTNNRGRLLPGSFNRKALGTSWDDIYTSSYSPNNDYAILQASSDISKFAEFDLEYGAWSNGHDYNNSIGYFCIHHPKGDVKKINKDNDRATEVLSDRFKLKYDLGITENGSSGAPVFNSSGQIVGFHVTSTANKDCSLVGQMNSTNGKFDDIYNSFNYILDPDGVGEATSSNPQPPTPSELPSHCNDCVQNYDETDIDCGGSCYPCGVIDVMTIKSDIELQGNIKSRYEIFAEPDPGTLLALKSGHSSLEAGLNIYLNGGFEVQKGATFYAGIDAELMAEADRGCQNPCINMGNVFTPNGDGVHDYLSMGQAFVSEYSIQVFNSWNQLIYSSPTYSVHANGIVYPWDGTGATSNGTYKLGITYKDCFGATHVDPLYNVYVGGLKSANINEEKQFLQTEAMKLETPKIKIYPNPFSDMVCVDFSGEKTHLHCKVTNISGQIIVEKEINSNSGIIHLNNIAAGTYFINVKAGDHNLVQKLIKK